MGGCWNLNVSLSNFGPMVHKNSSKQFMLEVLQGKSCLHSFFFFQEESIFTYFNIDKCGAFFFSELEYTEYWQILLWEPVTNPTNESLLLPIYLP